MTQHIISRGVTEVKTAESRVETYFREQYAQKWDSKKAKARDIAGKLLQIGEYKRAGRMVMCAQVVRMEVCQNCGTSHLKYSNLCRDRLCPICKWRLAMKRFATMVNIVESLRRAYPEASWQFVTLTCENCYPNELNAVLDEMARAWNCITSHPEFKKRIAGYARSTELTYNAEKGTLHPHYHILVMYEELHEPSNYIVRRWRQGLRRRAVREAQSAETIKWTTSDEKEIGWAVDQNPEDEAAINAILETFKYSTKDSDMDDMPLGVFRAVMNAIAKRRLVSFGGKIKEYAQLLQAGDLNDAGEEDQNELETSVDVCVHCRSRDLIEVVGTWAGGTYNWRRAED